MQKARCAALYKPLFPDIVVSLGRLLVWCGAVRSSQISAVLLAGCLVHPSRLPCNVLLVWYAWPAAHLLAGSQAFLGGPAPVPAGTAGCCAAFISISAFTHPPITLQAIVRACLEQHGLLPPDAGTGRAVASAAAAPYTAA